MASKNRGKRSSSKPRRRSEEQLDLFPWDLKLAPPNGTLGEGRRAAPKNRDGGRHAASVAPIRLDLF